MKAATSAPGVGILTAIEGFIAELGDWKLWRSLGWLLLGIVLMLLGAGWFIKGKIGPVPPVPL